MNCRSRPMLEFDLGDPFVNNNALHQQERSLSVAMPQIFPSFVVSIFQHIQTLIMQTQVISLIIYIPFDQNKQGELERDLQAQESLFHVSQNTLHPELFHQ